MGVVKFWASEKDFAAQCVLAHLRRVLFIDRGQDPFLSSDNISDSDFEIISVDFGQNSLLAIFCEGIVFIRKDYKNYQKLVSKKDFETQQRQTAKLVLRLLADRGQP